MGLVTATIRLKDTTPSQNPVPGVVVRFFTASDVFVTEETSDANGEVDVTLDGTPAPGTEYHVRAYRPGYSFSGPWSISVEDPTIIVPPNDWTMAVNIHEVANSPTPGMCRVSGYVKNTGYLPLPKGSRILFAPTDKTPTVLYETAMLGPVSAPVDEDDFIVVDLIRGAEYRVHVLGWFESDRRVTVPDRGGVRFADLIFPVPVLVEWTPAGPFSITAGGFITVVPKVTGSDYGDWGEASKQVDYKSSDESIFTVAYDSSGLILTGKSPGFAQLTAERKEGSFLVSPDRPFVGTPVAVSVV